MPFAEIATVGGGDNSDRRFECSGGLCLGVQFSKRPQRELLLTRTELTELLARLSTSGLARES